MIILVPVLYFSKLSSSFMSWFSVLKMECSRMAFKLLLLAGFITLDSASCQGIKTIK